MRHARARRVGLIVLAVSVIAAACGGGEEVAAECSPGQTDGDLNFYNWTEYIDPELITA